MSRRQDPRRRIRRQRRDDAASSARALSAVTAASTTTFGGTGVVTTAIGNYAGGGVARDRARREGRRRRAGRTRRARQFALARYNDDGSLRRVLRRRRNAHVPRSVRHDGDGTSILLQHLADGRARGSSRPARRGRTDGGRFAAIGVRARRRSQARRPPASTPFRRLPSSASCLRPPPPKRHCLVPRVVGQRLARARARIRRASMLGGPRAAELGRGGLRGIVAASERRGPEASQAAEGARLARRQPGPTALAGALCSSGPAGTLSAAMLRLG